MTEIVARFLQTNKSLLDKDLVEFFLSAYDGLSKSYIDELVQVLDTAGIDTHNARDTVLRFIITMETEVLEKPIRVISFAIRYIKGALGFDTEYIVEYIMENANEWDVNIEFINNDYYLVPREV